MRELLQHSHRSLLAILLLLSVATGAIAGQRIGYLVPGAGSMVTHVKSMRALRFTDMVQQHVDFSCGAASLATLLKYAYGRAVTEASVLEGLFSVSDPAVVRKRGFSLLNLKYYVEKLGMRGRGYKVSDAMLDHIEIPVIVLLDIKGYKHFVVLKKVEKNGVYIGDPALGNRVVSRRDFMREWNQIIFAVIGKGLERDTVLLNPPPPLTENQLVKVHNVISDAQLADFGFTRAEMF